MTRTLTPLSTIVLAAMALATAFTVSAQAATYFYDGGTLPSALGATYVDTSGTAEADFATILPGGMAPGGGILHLERGGGAYVTHYDTTPFTPTSTWDVTSTGATWEIRVRNLGSDGASYNDNLMSNIKIGTTVQNGGSINMTGNNLRTGFWNNTVTNCASGCYSDWQVIRVVLSGTDGQAYLNGVAHGPAFDAGPGFGSAWAIGDEGGAEAFEFELDYLAATEGMFAPGASGDPIPRLIVPVIPEPTSLSLLALGGLLVLRRRA